MIVLTTQSSLQLSLLLVRMQMPLDNIAAVVCPVIPTCLVLRNMMKVHRAHCAILVQAMNKCIDTTSPTAASTVVNPDPLVDYMTIAPTNYILKLIIAIALTPLIYAGHWAVRRYLREAHG